MSAVTAAPAVQASRPIPTLAEPAESDSTGSATPRAATEGEEKKKKRNLFGFGKKKTEEPAKPPSKPASTTTTKPPTTTRATPASPILTDHARFSPSSPTARSGFASSPRLASPAGSQIFERNVQETVIPSSPAIPSHIQTENYIPPVLDASSSAITDGHLNPDTVEIITHPSHQPAGLSITNNHQQLNSPTLANEPSWADELAAFSAQRGFFPTPNTTTNPNATADTASTNYGSFDTTDVRRLSFISFADVVQAEQQHFGGPSSRDSMHLGGFASLSSSGVIIPGRSPSPMRSPVSSSGGEGKGGRSEEGSVKGLAIGGNGVGSEVAIETMSQALRRTGSGDLGGGAGAGGVRSFPASPV